MEANMWVVTITQWLALLLYAAVIILVIRMAFFFFSSRESANWQTIKYRLGYPAITFLMIGLAFQYAPAWMIKQVRLGLPAGIAEANLLAAEVAEALPPLPVFGGDQQFPTPAPGGGNLTPDPGSGGGAPPTPAPGVTNIVHSVEVGETLFEIAARYVIDLDALRLANPHIVGDKIKPGDFLNVPVPSSPTPIATPTSIATPPPPPPTPTATTDTPNWNDPTRSAQDNWDSWQPGDQAPTPMIATPTRSG